MNAKQENCVNDLIELDKAIKKLKDDGKTYSVASLELQGQRYALFVDNERSFGGAVNLINILESKA